MAEVIFAGLEPRSKSIVESYFLWSRQKREKFGRDIDFDSKAYTDARATRATYDKEEVQAIIAGHLDVLKASIEKQEHFHSMASAELIRTVLLEADKHRLAFNINGTEVLGNVSALTALEAAEQKMIGASKGRLAPITSAEKGDEGARALIKSHDEIRSLNDQVRRLQEQLARAAKEMSDAQSNRLAVQDRLLETESSLAGTTRQTREEAQRDATQLSKLRSEVATLNREMNEKLAASRQFQNLKMMLTEKNAQVKRLRAALMRFDPTAAGEDDDIAAEDDDE